MLGSVDKLKLGQACLDNVVALSSECFGKASHISESWARLCMQDWPGFTRSSQAGLKANAVKSSLGKSSWASGTPAHQRSHPQSWMQHPPCVRLSQQPFALLVQPLGWHQPSHLFCCPAAWMGGHWTICCMTSFVPFELLNGTNLRHTLVALSWEWKRSKDMWNGTLEL